MKYLFILRHAKAARGEPQTRDFDRPINEIGQTQIPIIGNILKNEKLMPEIIISSSAKRTRQTSELMAGIIGYKKNYVWLDELYETTPDQYLKILQKLPDHLNTVMIVGHNPTHEQFLSLLIGESISLSTGALAYVSLSIDRWKDLREGINGEVIGLWKPKELM